ncbi:VWD domain-containing protein [Dolichospermum planctonicum UHCC 0167]|uniref:Calx-beta domain-containing protein n=1 Tax=Dolichospermum planctonicum TaxID=136072 RepID=UPI001C2B8D2A|nr:Calx-beta domain-containing protein [Dolichospermum planctonicum]MCW9679746.1 VWD domain-containing protein [Dolichospermum planctonicum UHCC 0167]
MNLLLNPVLTLTYNQLIAFSNTLDFWNIFDTAFGTQYNRSVAEILRLQWQAGNFSQLPQIDILDSSILGSANGAYASSTNKIYLSNSFLETATPTAVSAVLLEEIGHFVDAHVNQSDSAGDEGAIFAALVQGESLDAETLQGLTTEDDSAIVRINGEAVQVEQNTPNSPLINGLGGTAGFGENILNRNDDSSTELINVTSVFESGLNFFGTTYNSFYINNNGNITFSSPQSTYTPFALTGNTSQPIIAPFFADVDTSAGTVTPSVGGTSTGSNLLYWDLDPTNNQVIITWDDVGAYSGGTVPNAFQLILKDTGSGNFSIDFRYENIEWLVGSASGNNLARAGYSAGNGVNFFELPQSGTNTMADLESASNVNVPGKYVFLVTNGTPNQQPNNINLTATTINENTPNNTVVGTLSTVDPDVGDAHTYTLLDNADGRFAIVGNELRVANQNLINFEANSSHNITIKTTDNLGATFTKDFTITINNVNETPTDLGLSKSTVRETQPIGTVVGDFITTDPDTGNTFTYSLVTGTGSTDNAAFTIAGNQLKTNAVFNYATKNSYSIRIKTTDQGGLSFEKQLTIGITTPGILSFSSPQFTLREDGTPIAAVTVIRNFGGEGAISATINFKDGTAKAPSDYNNTAITVNFADGEISKTVTIPIINDTIAELDETLQLILTNPTGGATIGQQNSASLTIIDNDASLLITGLPQGASGSNEGQTTIVISGQNFSPNDQISLISATGTPTTASKVYWINETEAWATFNLQGLATGNYDVKVTNGQNSFVANDIFTVTNGAVGNIQTQLSYSANGVVTVRYTNAGQTDVIAPLFRITPTNAQVTYPEENTVSATLRQLLNLYLGTSDNGPAGILAPGESGEFSFAYTPNGNGLINFAVQQVQPNEVINWASIKAESRADYYTSSEAWDATWSNLTDALGTTTGQFQTVMAENANYLSQLGQETNDLSRLFAFEWQQAGNNLNNVSLISTTDVVDAAPGLSLTFNRTFYQSIAERYNLGSLGRGWASQWDLRATTNSKGDVVIRSVGDLQRVFEKQTDGVSYLEDGGATLTITNGQYRLKEASGLISLFGTDGKLSYVEDTNGNKITLEYTNNNLTKLLHTNGDSLTLAYNAQGRISQITDSTGQITSYSYDTSGENLLSVTSPEGTTTYTYDTGNIAAKKYSLLSVTSDLGYQRTFEYDNQGRLTKEFSNGQTQTLTYSYDNVGGVTITDSTGASQTILLDDRGNSGQIRGVNNQNLIFSYDADGNLIGATLPNGSETGYTYDTNGNLTQQTNLLNQDVKFTYDATFNQLTGFIDPKGNGVNYTYDLKGNLTKITYSDGSSEQFSVDGLGNITSSVNRRGSTIGYTYNTSGLLTKKQYADGSSVTYGYDTKGNLTSVTDATGTIAMQYDAANQLTKITYPTGRSLTYTYNADGQRTKLVSQDGYTVNYTYDTVGRLKTLTNGTAQSIISYDYDSAGRLIKETNGNGTYTTYEYDQQSQLTKLINYKADNTVNSKFEYAYDNLGRRTTMTTLEGTFQYGYDATGQLTSVLTPTNRTINYQYDAAGNRIGVTDNGTTTNYNTNNLNQYTNVGNAVYTYDTDGNLISKTQGGQTSTYTYDVENRLTKVVNAQGTWEYQYDGLGNRVATILNGQRTEYLLDPLGLGDIVGEYNGSTLVANYTHGIGLVSRVNGSNSNYYDADAIGSTIGLTANDGSYVNRYSYLPFGEDLTKVEGVANPFEYVGQWGVMDEGNGLDFMRARFYDTSLGRFTAVDPIGLLGGDTNLYRYVSNDPVIYADPSGLARFVYRPLSGSLGGLYPIGRNPLDNYTNTEIAHEQIFFDDGTNIGFFDDGRVRPDNQENLKNYDQNSKSKYYDDDRLRKAIDNVKVKPYSVIPLPDGKDTDNCQSWAERVRDEYERLKREQNSEPPTLPTPDGGTYNDPHLQTLDGIGYDFQTVGEFTLVKSTTDDFEIQTRQQPWGNSTSASANSAIAIKIGGQRIAIYANQTNPLLINGTAVTLPDGGLYAVGQNLIIRSGSQYSIVTANNDLILVNNRGTWLNINLGLADNRQGKVVGLLGNFNDNRNDDFALRDGTVIGGTITDQQLYGDYANSWRITQANSLFDYASGQTTATFTDLTFPRNIITTASLTPEQRAAAEQIARNAGITDPSVLEDVILDIHLSNGNTEFIQGAISGATDQQRIETVSAPNTLINPDGLGTQHYLTAGAVIPYTIRFSNNAAAGTTPVAQVTITQTLDTDLDLNTFTLQDFGFGDITVDVPNGVQNYSQRLDLRSTRGVFVDASAELNTATGVITWTFTAIDPATGNAANSTTQGFLPPNDQNGAGSGFVAYRVQPKANSANNTRVDAQASITFNTQTPIQTTAVFNTLDSNAPTSQVTALPANSNANFTVSWTGTDNGSGIASYDIYVATDGGQYVLWQDDITATSGIYNGLAGKTYSFYSVATDNLGLTETAPTQADATTTIVTTQPVINLSANQTIVEGFTSPQNVAYTVSLSSSSTQTITVQYATSNETAQAGADYISTTGTLTFNPGVTSQVINIPILNDAINEANETFTLTLSNPTNATLGTSQTATTTITDTVLAAATTTLPATVENLTLTGTTAINGTGNAGNNILTGNSSNNTLNGGAGVDTLVGGTGDDIYIVDSTTDTITEQANQGIDTVQSSVTFTLANVATVENLTLTGTTAINGTGNTGNNILTGNSANNTLNGEDGNDTLNGGTGIDTLIGGAGNDIYVVDTTTDVITEVASQGTDTVQSSVTFTLANVATVENLTLTGTTAINGTGNTGNNILTGNGGNNTLNGGDGNDTLIGGDGNDTLYGEDGNDTISGGVGSDAITGGLGTDRFVYSNFSDSLLAAPDRIIDFNPGESDRIALTSLPTTLFNAGIFSTATTLNAAAIAAYQDANPNLAGTQSLTANQAVFFGWNDGTYLSVNDGLSAFNSSSDLLINVTGMTGTIATGLLTTNNYFSV